MGARTMTTGTAGNVMTQYSFCSPWVGKMPVNITDQTHTAGVADSILTDVLVMGRISATKKIVPFDSAASDGSERPLGLLRLGYAASVTIPATTTVTNLVVAVQETVIESKITFKSGITLDSVSNGMTLRDQLMKQGIIIISATELSV